MKSQWKRNALLIAVVTASFDGVAAGDDEQGGRAVELADTVVIGTAEEELKQAPGVSIITADDIKKRPPVNDLSDIVRKMPGVNLSGNSASGVRGNNRQIDLRGMGPENTLILIDGKPVLSRNSVRYTRSGERDTRGDSNWVPAEMVERIEVLRGPAAARYGSGSMGGVVNIITKRPSERMTGSITTYTSVPEDSAEGVTKRTNFNLAGPLSENLTFRAYGNLNKTDADDADINLDNTTAVTSNGAPNVAAGREGVRNKDVNGLLSWALDDRQTLDFEAGFSRQGNIYAGDVGSGATTALDDGSVINGLLGRETNTMYRQNFAVTHTGHWDFGTSKLLAQYDNTRNRRFIEGNTGSVDGNISASSDKRTNTLDNYFVQGQLDMPLELVFEQMLTLGAEWNRQSLDDPQSINQQVGGQIPGCTLSGGGRPCLIPLPNSAAGARPTDISIDNRALFAENNIQLTPDWTLTPGVRLDDHDKFGLNWSPSLNSAYILTDDITLKGGIAKAFKAPNLYQINPNYLIGSAGNGCAAAVSSTNGCYILGNDSLEPETSINKELGIAFRRAGWSAGVTYFRNDYDNKIVAANIVTGVANGNGGQFTNILQWDNAKDAVIKGWEGNVGIPLLGEEGETLSWNSNITYMQDNKDGDGNPLSVVPKYTVNTMLDWQVTHALSLSLTGTFYGEQKPRVVNPNLDTPVTSESQLRPREAYHIWGVGGSYALTRNLTLGAGVNNLFDKRLYREGTGTNAGANTYNEPGRSFYASVTASF